MELSELKKQINGIQDAVIRECALELVGELEEEWGGFSDKCTFEEWMDENIILSPEMLDEYMHGFYPDWNDYAEDFNRTHTGEEYREASQFICREVFKNDNIYGKEYQTH